MKVLKAQVIKVIRTSCVTGKGTEESPLRYLYQYWDIDGNLLSEHDTIQDSVDLPEIFSHQQSD